MRILKGWSLGSGCALPSWGPGGLPQKKNQFCAKNYAILSKFWYFFPILQQKVGGGLSPSPESGGPIPLSPPAPTPMVVDRERTVRRQTDEREGSWCSGSMTLTLVVPDTPPSSLEWKQATIVSRPLRVALTVTVAAARSYGSMSLQRHHTLTAAFSCSTPLSPGACIPGMVS